MCASASGVTFEHVDPGSALAQDALSRYFAELHARFTTGFDAATAGGDDVAGMRPPNGSFVVVRDEPATIGCGGLQRLDGSTAEVKRMWIDPDRRSLGLGRRLLAELERIAREQGRRRIVLDTNETLTEAIAMYERAGYRAIERYNDNPYAHHWFARDL